MPPKRALPSIEISFFAHATEDREKVFKAAKNLLTEEISNDLTFRRNEVRGYFGNPIMIFKSEIQGEAKVKAFLERVSSRLGEAEKESLQREIDRHLDAARNLYLRFDKQAAYLNNVRFAQSDPIHIRLRVSTAHGSRGGVLETLQSVGLLPS